jgi:hypothetical protein
MLRSACRPDFCGGCSDSTPRHVIISCLKDKPNRTHLRPASHPSETCARVFATVPLFHIDKSSAPPQRAICASTEMSELNAWRMAGLILGLWLGPILIDFAHQLL